MSAIQASGTMPPRLDTNVLTQVIVGVEIAQKQQRLVFKPENKAKLIILLYEYFLEDNEAEEDPIGILPDEMRHDWAEKGGEK